MVLWDGLISSASRGQLSKVLHLHCNCCHWLGKALMALACASARRSVRRSSAISSAFADGNLPMIAGTDILKATTVSGTMVMGLAPIFLLAPLVKYSPWSFHLAFWPGVILGVLLALDAIPASWAIGNGKYALLLGTNFYGLMTCFAGFLLPLLWQRWAHAARA